MKSYSLIIFQKPLGNFSHCDNLSEYMNYSDRFRSQCNVTKKLVCMRNKSSILHLLRTRREKVTKPLSSCHAFGRSTSRTTSSDSKQTILGFYNENDPSLIRRLGTLLWILTLSRVGVYIPVSNLIDTKAFGEALESTGGLMGYIDALTGGSVSKVGLFSLGIVPFINASIVMQLMTSVFPSLKKIQRDEGPAGRQKFSQYQKILTLVFALAQGSGQLNYLRPLVSDFSTYWLFENTMALATGALILTFFANEIDKLKLGNGTSILIFANILSSMPTFLGTTLLDLKAAEINKWGDLLLFISTILGIVYVQEAERKIPINYASRYSGSINGAMGRTSYLPFKVNATGVMPIIFASSLLSLPATVSRFANNDFIQKVAVSLSPDRPLYTAYNVGLIFLFNYFYTFIQFEPNEVAENLNKSSASIPAVRPGKATAEYLEGVLIRMSVLGSVFLGLLALAPSILETVTGVSRFRGFGGTSILILVGVATDFTRRLRAEKLMEKYKDLDKFYQ